VTAIGITIEPHDHGATVVTLRGELDLSVAEPVRRALSTALAGGPTSMVIDLYEASFLDMGMLDEFVRGRDAAAPHGVALHVVGAHGIVRKVFELTGTETLIADWQQDDATGLW
jgi:anti-sigma B factor antagonist